MSETFDHIVIGGGAAGCVTAAKLVTGSGAKVLLLEAGYSHHHPLLDMPPGIFKMINGSKYMKYYPTTPQAHLDGRIHEIPQGNVLGGGSSVNAQIYMRGRPSDYNDWDNILKGNAERTGWGYDEVLPYFIGQEDNNRLNDEYHGHGGPLQVSDPGHTSDLSRAFLKSMQGIGEPYNHDFNGASQRGVGLYQFMNRYGKRCSSAYSHTEALKNDPRLTVRLESPVSKVIIENNKAKGVIYRDNTGKDHTVLVDGEVIITAGALISPQILMLSGIGQPEQLAEHGVDCLIDLPGVGENFIDHPEVPIIATCNGPYGYFKQGDGWRMVRNGIQFKLFGTGPVTSAGVDAGGFMNPLNPDGIPSVQCFCVPTIYLDRDVLGEQDPTYGLTVTTVVIKPKSRGHIRLASANPADMPLISPNLLKEPEDMEMMIAAQKYVLQAFQGGPLAEKLDKIVLPSPEDHSDDGIKAYCKKFVKTNYHPAGSCAMGADDDPMAVLDSKMRVRGVEGLRVADMSICPDIMAGNTQAPAMIFGDRCADFIMGIDSIKAA